MALVRELLSLEGRTALVTGGAGVLGRRFGEALAELGAEVCLVDLDLDRAQTAASALQEQFGARAWGERADISLEADVVALQERVLAHSGRLDILVNNAAYAPSDAPPDGLSLDAQSLVRWQRQLDVLLTGAFLTSRAFACNLAEHGHGSIINMASIYGLLGPDLSLYADTAMTNPAAYAAGKGGLIQLTRYLATTLAPGVRVNAIAPGGLERGQPEVFQARYHARTPMGRMAAPDDVVGALVYLASDLGRYVTGQVLAVDGGWSAW